VRAPRTTRGAHEVLGRPVELTQVCADLRIRGNPGPPILGAASSHRRRRDL